MTKRVQAYAAPSQGAKLIPFEYDQGPLGDQQVEIKISHCGACHSDVSMIDNEWGISNYPLVPGHEVVGTVVDTGRDVKGDLTIGRSVGLGWFSGSCMACSQCLSGDHNDFD